MLYGPGDHGGHDGCNCHGPGRPRGYYGYGPGGYYGRGPGWGPGWGPMPYGLPPRILFGRFGKDDKIDYMKTVDYDGEGKKYYNACACKNCTEPFAVDYRVMKNLTFICTSDLGFKNGTFYSDNKIDGYFKFDITCPSCQKYTPFFIRIRRLPKFVLDYYLKETTNVEYSIRYSYDNFYAPFNVSYTTAGTTINELYAKINSLKFDVIVHENEKIPTNLEKMNNAVLREYNKNNNKTCDIKMESVGSNLNKQIEVSKLKLLKYLITSNGFISGLNKYMKSDENSKKEFKLLSK